MDTVTSPPLPSSPPSPSRSRLWLVLVAVALVVVLVVAAGLYYFFRDDAPDEVNLEQTVDAVTAEGAEGADAGEATGEGGAPTGIDGTWTVDTSVGEFSVEDNTTATFVGFRVNEELQALGSTTAVGRTPDVTGTVEIADETVTAAEITADLRSVISNDGRRDGAIQQSLNTGANPDATFVLSSPIELGPEAAAGEPIETTAAGQLTLNGVTNDVELALSAQLVEGRVLVTGSTEVVFADYEIQAPSAPIVLSVEDRGIAELQLWLGN